MFRYEAEFMFWKQFIYDIDYDESGEACTAHN